jgi:BolA protein
MRGKIEAAFAPLELVIENESHKHAHHREMQAGGPQAMTGETHFRLRVVAEAFIGKSRVERHRMIYELLAPEIERGVHAIAISALAPDEARR